MLEIVEGKAIGGSGWAPVLAASLGARLPTRGPGQRGLARRYTSLAGGSAEDCKRASRASAPARSGRWRNGSNRPVLKHGPRSLTCMRVGG